MTPSVKFRFNIWFAVVLLLSLVVLLLFSSSVLFAGSASTNPTTADAQPALVVPQAASSQLDNLWRAGFDLPGTNGIVYAAVIGSNGDLYIGGQFSVAGDVDVSNIARWDGTQWHTLNSDMNGVVNALAIGSDGTLYAAGTFTSIGTCTTGCKRIAAWNGTAWSALGAGIDGPGGTNVYTLFVNAAGDLYAGGAFATAGTCLTDCNNIARWNGTTWSPLHNGTSGPVYALAEDGTANLYVGGAFLGVTDCADCLNIGKWNGTSWSALETGTWGGAVYALAIDSNDNVYAGGDFFNIGSCGAGDCFQLGKWDGTAWSSTGFDDSSSQQVTELAFNANGTLYVYAGYPSSAGKLDTWNGATWSNIDPNMFDVKALVINNDGKVYIGGWFSYVSDCWRGCISVAQLSGGVWSSLGQNGSGPDRAPSSLVFAEDGDLYAAGIFGSAGTCVIDCGGVARWDGSNWHGVGNNSPFNGTDVLAFDSMGTLYAGGGFGVSQLDGVTWSPMGDLINGYVETMVVDSNDTLYIGGNFSGIGDCFECWNIAKWSGTAWEPLDIGIFTGKVHALAVDSVNNLYVGGEFQGISGSSTNCDDCNYIAKWTGSEWTPLASTPNTTVRALALDSADTLYAGGNFSNAGSCFSDCNYIAKWNGTVWSPLHSGVNGVVQTLVVDTDDTLYAGGKFTSAGSCTSGCTYLAYWNGTTWLAVSGGTDGEVIAMALNRQGLVHVSGYFSHAGDEISRYFAVQSGNVYLPLVIK